MSGNNYGEMRHYRSPSVQGFELKRTEAVIVVIQSSFQALCFDSCNFLHSEVVDMSFQTQASDRSSKQTMTARVRIDLVHHTCSKS
jgi:hypothetical protein